jgi:hypothetical protein
MTPTPPNRLSTLIGSWLLLEGIWGMFNPVVFGFITTNPLRAGIHILLGFVGLFAAFNGFARKYLWGAGLIVLAVGVMYFIPAGRGITDRLAVNSAAAVINVVIGASAVICAIRCSNEVRPLRR